MFEDKTYDSLLSEALGLAPDGVDTREGSIYYDAIAGIILKIAKFYTDLESVMELVFLTTASGEYLDLKAAEQGVTRLSATKSKYYVTFEGITPDINERFFSDGIYFALQMDEDDQLYLEAEEAGSQTNSIYSGTSAIPVNNISGLTSSTFGEKKESGTDEEEDDALRERVLEKISGPAENGNRQQYKSWCEEVDGVGRARIVPLWEGPNTVKGVIVNSLGLPAEEVVVKRVQEYIDPDDDNDGRGDGLGEGVAGIGAHFTAFAATGTVIDVSVDVSLAEGQTIDSAKAEAQEAFTELFKEMALNTSDDSNIIVRITTIGAALYDADSILDYSNLTLNQGTSNIELDENAVPVLGEVSMSVL